MEVKKEQQLEKAYQSFIDSFLDMDFPLEQVSSFVDPEINGYGTTTDEHIKNLGHYLELLQRQREQGKGTEIIYERNPILKRLNAAEDSALYVEEFMISMKLEAGTHQIPLRISALFHYNNLWKLVHWHGSQPVATKNDSWHLDEWRQKNEALQNLVDEQTADLAAKNRELIIEAALDRVRAASMAMHHSNELQDAVNVIYDQILSLGINVDAINFQIFNDEDRDTEVWVAEGAKLYDKRFSLSYLDFGASKDVFQARENNVHFIAKQYNSVEMSKWWRSVFETTDFRFIPTERKDLLLNASGWTFSLAMGKWSGIQFNRYNLADFTKEDYEVQRRFAQVFEQTYTRFLDLQKAEEQAMEAEIEATLERIRSTSLAMHSSSDMYKVVNVIFEQVLTLGIEAAVAYLNIDIRKLDVKTLWIASSAFKFPEVLVIPYKDNKFDNSLRDAIINSEPFVETQLDNKEFRKALKLFFKFVPISYPEERKKELRSTKHSTVGSTINELTGFIIQRHNNRSFNEHEINIIKRIGSVFEQAYKRYLDLQKAESQAREAQIEAALERIRSESLAMHKSSDMHKVVNVIFEQVGLLKVDASMAYLNSDIRNTEYKTLWLATADVQYPEVFKIPYIDEKMDNSILEALKNSSKFWEVHLNNKELRKSTDHFFKNAPNRVSKEKRELVMSQKHSVLGGSINEQTSFILQRFGSKSFTESEINIIQRIGGVFEQSYKRYLDIQKAEAQAREAQIEISLERVRSKSMAMHKSDELLGVVRTLYGEFETLNVPVDLVGIRINKDNSKDMHFWVSTADGLYDKLIFWPFQDIRIFHDIHNSQVSGELMSMAFSKAEIREFFREYFKLETVPKERRAAVQKNEVMEWLGSFLTNTGLFIVKYENESYSEEEGDIVKRFARVFEQTYIRFLDLQKAETQAREAQIEAALERVRARSLAMQNSEDLADLSKELVQQVQGLGVETWFCAFNIYDDESEGSLEWGCNGINTFPKYRTPREGVFLKYYEAGQKGESLLVNEINENECAAHYEYLSSLPGVGDQLLKMKAEGIPFPTAQIDHVAYFNAGYLLFITYEAVPTAHSIFRRFAKVFEQSYTRFLDLKSAEAQAREAQVEAALERVRTTSMAMHNSKELVQVVLLVNKEILNLGIHIDNTQIFTDMTDDPKNGSNMWMAAEQQEYLQKFHLPYIDDPIEKNSWELRAKGVNICLESYSKSEKNSYLRKLFKHSDLKHIPKDRQKIILDAPGWARCSVAMKNSSLSLGRWSPKEFTKEEGEICLRFGQVFEQAYTRFLDLRRAEEQAREAQIEASLEKIRARSMAMHNSEELQDVINTAYNTLVELDINMSSANFDIFNGTGRDFYSYISGPNSKYPPRIYIPAIEFGTSKAIMDARERGDDFVAYQSVGKEMKKWFDFAFEHTDMGKASSERKEQIRNSDCWTTSIAINNYSAMQLNRFSKELFSEAENNILKRFAKVFEQTYIRFLDLQKAENQAREAEIEAAVERVRSEAMAMHHPSDLVKVTQVLIKEITHLGIHGITGAAFILVDDNDIVTMWDISDPGNMGYTRDNKSVYDPREFKMLGEFWRKWKRGDEYFVIKYDLEKNKKGLEEWKQVDEKNYESLKRAIKKDKLKTQWNPYGSFSRGLLTLDMMSKPDEDTEKILVKMARTFDLAYQRFDDLQKAEAQAKEAKKQASLDRIRAEIGSMRNEKDLESLTPLIWSELSSLEVPFFRCGVFIVDDIKGNVQLYLSTPTGEPIAVITLDHNTNAVADDVISNWRKQETYKAEWEREQFVDWSKDLMSQGLIDNVKDYQHNDLPPEKLFLQFIPFKQGMLYIGSEEFLSEDHMRLVHDVASDFSIAYARYEDFINLETAKHLAENTLGELRSTQSQLVHAEKMASLGELTAGIAHEIQNPLNFVNNFSEVSTELIDEMREEIEKGNMIDVKEIATDLRQNLEKINHHGKRAGDIVKGMLQHSRAGSGKKEPTDINLLCDEYLRLAYHGLRAKNKSFNSAMHTEFDNSLEKINVIPQDIGRVILNLITNAFYACSEQSKRASADRSVSAYQPLVTVSTKKEGDKVLISVKDNGGGIPGKVREKIFQPFFTTKPTGQGTGLGLSLSYDIVKAHGGELKVETKEGEGSEFTIILKNE